MLYAFRLRKICEDMGGGGVSINIYLYIINNTIRVKLNITFYLHKLWKKKKIRKYMCSFHNTFLRLSLHCSQELPIRYIWFGLLVFNKIKDYFAIFNRIEMFIKEHKTWIFTYLKSNGEEVWNVYNHDTTSLWKRALVLQ